MDLLNQFSNVAFEYVYLPQKYPFDLTLFLYKEALKVVGQKLRKLHTKGKCFKISLEVQVKFRKMADHSIESNPWFKSENMICLYTTMEWRSKMKTAFEKIETSANNYLTDGSDWTFQRVQEFRAKIALFQPLSGGCYRQLPANIKRKKALGILSFEDDQCFLHAVAAGIDHYKHPEQYKRSVVVKYQRLKKIEHNLDDTTIGYPTSISQIGGFEKRNNHLAINVFSLAKTPSKETPLSIMYKSKSTGGVQIFIDLLHHEGHYFPIFHLSRLLHMKRGSLKRLVCRNCLFLCTTEKSLNNHKRFCDRKGIVYSASKNKILKFDYYKALCPNDNVIYFDTESMLVKTTSNKLVAEHRPIAVAAKRVCVNAELNSNLFCYVGEDCIEKFLDWIIDEEAWFEAVRDLHSYPLRLSSEDERRFRTTRYCDFCRIKFPRDGSGKYRDHCHLTSGRLRFVLCNTCNLNRADYCRQIPIVSHCGTNYDHKFILRGIGKFVRDRHLKRKRFSVLPKNEEKHSIIFFDKFTFIDSYQFLNESLDSLVSSKRRGKNDLAEEFPEIAEFVGDDPKKLKLLSRKGKFPFEYVDCMEKLDEEQLPPKEAFYDSLKNQDISMEDYEHCQRVFKVFECRNLMEYMLVYLKSDVLLLNSVFEEYRKISQRKLSMDPARFFSASHFTFQAMLRYTGVELEIIQDLEIVHMIRQSIRGGLSLASKRYLEANDPMMEDYDPERPDVEIVYIDCSNMYGYALKQCLPEKDFRWLTKGEIKNLNVENIEDDDDTGYILECDFEFPESVHDRLKDFVPLLEKMEVAPAHWSPYMMKQFAKTCKPFKAEPEKLTSHFGPRRHYVIHYVHLKLCLELGINLKRIHRVLAFTQSTWMAPYIDECTRQRQLASSSFESNYWKGLVCSCYGKTVEDVTKRAKVSLITSRLQFLRASRKLNFKSFNIYDPHFAGMVMKQQIIYMNKPIQVGYTVLEIAKAHMTRFYHLTLKKKLGDDLTLAYTDTDSFVLELKNQTKSFTEFMYHHKKYFDLSNLPENSPYYWSGNKRVPGTFKNECPYRVITRFVALRSKVYCMEFDDQEQKDELRLKGLPKVVTKQLTFEDYYRTLFNSMDVDKPKRHSYHAIRSKKQHVYTIKEQKVGLSSWDSKRYILDDGFTTLPYFHKDIRN